MATAPGTVEAPERLLDIYEDFPSNVSDYLAKADQGDDQAIDRLRDIWQVAEKHVDPWHKDMFDDIFRTRHKVTDREAILCRSLVALTQIKEQAQEGEPFVYYGPNWSSTTAVTAGTLGKPEEFTVFGRYPGLQLEPAGVAAWLRSAGFPQLDLEHDYKPTINLFPEHHANDAWDHLPKIANGTGYVAFGTENVARNIEQREVKEQGFYAALALWAAGVQLAFPVDRGEIDRAKQAVANMVAFSANGHAGGTLAEKPVEDLRLLLDFLGLEKDDVTSAAHLVLKNIISNRASSPNDIGSALVREQNVDAAAEALFAESDA